MDKLREWVYQLGVRVGLQSKIIRALTSAESFIESLDPDQIEDFEYAEHYDSEGHKVYRFVVTLKKRDGQVSR